MASRIPIQWCSVAMIKMTMMIIASVAGVHSVFAQDPSAPQGRPPLPPLRRVDPCIYDIRFTVSLLFTSGTKGNPDMVELEQHAVELPVITTDSLCQMDVSSPRIRVTLSSSGGNRSMDLPVTAETASDGTTLLLGDAKSFVGQHSRFDISWRTQVWQSALDEKIAATIAWPVEWPKEALPFLKPDSFIESDAPAFAQFVQKVSQGQSVRSVPVHIAAKELIKGAIGLFNSVDSSGAASERGQIRGMRLQGALAAATAGSGSSHDLVCVCVAALRSAGIPARPVVGVIEPSGKGATSLISWGEYFLPGSGWVVFDPLSLRGAGVASMPVDRPWPHLGELDEDDGIRIPISHWFRPPGSSMGLNRYPAIWGWRATGRFLNDGDWFDSVQIQVTSRGKGVADP